MGIAHGSKNDYHISPEGVESHHLYQIIQPLQGCGFSPFLTEGFTHGY